MHLRGKKLEFEKAIQNAGLKFFEKKFKIKILSEIFNIIKC